MALETLILPDSLERIGSSSTYGSGAVDILLAHSDTEPATIDKLTIRLNSKILEVSENNHGVSGYDDHPRFWWLWYRNVRIEFSDLPQKIPYWCFAAWGGAYKDGIEYTVDITIPDSVEEIEDYALHCSYSSLTIPSSVTRIGKAALARRTPYAPEPTVKFIKFESSENWYATPNSDYTSGELIDLSDPQANIELLNNKYSAYYLYKASN